jgi:GntR family transcriptional regulator
MTAHVSPDDPGFGFRAPRSTAPASSPRRVYELLRAEIRSASDDGAVQFVEHPLTRSMGASRSAVRGALQMLAADGLVSRRRRSGTSVTNSIVEIPAGEVLPLRSYDSDNVARVTIEELDHRVVQSTPGMRARLETDARSVLLTEQAFYLEGRPLFVRVGYTVTDLEPADFHQAVLDIDSGPPEFGEVFQLLHGRPFGRSETVLEAVPCEARTARILDIAERSPVLMREMILRDDQDVPRNLSYTHFRGDRVALSASTTELRRLG